MSEASYHDAVREFLESRGWRVSTTAVQEGVTVLAGVRDSEGGSVRALTMVVEGPESEVGSEHLKFLLDAGEKKDADRLALTATADVPEAVRNACSERNIDFIVPDTVRSSVGEQGLDGVDDISMPEADQSPRQPPQHGGTDAGRSDTGSRAQSPAHQARTESAPAQQQTAKQRQPRPDEGGTDRRTVLLGGAGVLALGAGGWYVFLRDDGGPDSLEETVRTFVTATNNGNREQVNALIADGANLDPWTAEEAARAAEDTREMTEFEVVEREDGVARVDVTLRVSDSEVTETATVRYELRRIDGDWKFWDVVSIPDDNYLQTEAEETGQESTAQVANNIDITAKVGKVNSTGDGISMIRLNVKRTPGSDDVDLTELSIQYVGDNGFANYEYAGAGDSPNAYHVAVITAQSRDDTVLTDDGDRYELFVPFDDPDTADPDIEDMNGNDSLRVADITTDLATGNSAEIEITTADGATRNVVVDVPETISDGLSTVSL